MTPTGAEPYNLDPDFERACLYLASTLPEFWARIGKELDPELVEVPGAALLLRMLREIAKEGSECTSTLVPIQRLRRYNFKGTVTQEQIEQVGKIFDDAEDAGIPDPDLCVAELVPVIRRRLQSKAILIAHDEYRKGSDFQVVQDILEHANSLGRVESVVSADLGSGFGVIRNERVTTMLPTGVLELDLQLDGGPPQQTLGMWIADSGSGKSVALCNQAATGLKLGMFTGVVTVELPRKVWMARMYSNLTGVPWKPILVDERATKLAQTRMEMVNNQLGRFELIDMEPDVTTVRDIELWIERMEQKHGQKMQLLIVDYGDRLAALQVRDRDNKGRIAELVWGALRRRIAEKRNMWVWTAAQSQRPSKDAALGRRVEMKDVAEGYWKSRLSQLVVTLTPQEDGTNLIWVPKFNFGKAMFEVAGLMKDLERARLVPVTREIGPWAI